MNPYTQAHAWLSSVDPSDLRTPQGERLTSATLFASSHLALLEARNAPALRRVERVREAMGLPPLATNAPEPTAPEAQTADA